ncbi:MAG: alanine racemase [Candidatus Marinimicrobia bacterium]|nr:alanine racemase [Candidatus Neomarinimicrobiota bacterium]|tara:strand:- start:5748 stop:6857 length:1110 start_codon:yes stop_codon:yes gene_type:complete
MANPVAEIDLDRLRHNARLVMERTGGSELLAVVKANGYGHGAVPVSRALQQAGINYLGVFSIDEATELRIGGVECEILIFERLTSRAVRKTAEESVTVNLSWFGDLDILKNAVKEGLTLPKFHLKLDTGMTRLGIPWKDAASFTERVKQETGAEPEGVYTHLSTSDEGDLAFANQQLQAFEQAIQEIREVCSPKWVHIANSGAIVNMPDSYFNMVRVGMLLYGAHPSADMIDPLKIEPVMNFKGEIVLVRPVQAGTPISYGALYRPEVDGYIGIVQVGFADGMPRPWFERGVVMMKGKRYKIAGRICMDQFMVDFGEDEPDEGETVLIWGKDGENNLPIDEISEEIGINPYTLFSGLGGQRVERVFLNE